MAQDTEKPITTVVGEDKAPFTTLAVGEEHVITTLVGESATPHPDYAQAVAQTGTPTTTVGEGWKPSATTAAGQQIPTTLATGEEQGGGGTGITTEIAGEESGG